MQIAICVRRIAWVLVLGLAVIGCQTSSTSGKHLASVVISGVPPAAIRDAARQVFEAQGYSGAWGVRSIVFQRRASTLDNLTYGGWDLSSVTLRVELMMNELDNADYRLDCDVRLVRDAGDHVLEESRKTGSRAKYQKLLNQVRDRAIAHP
jgi:hypothetical protein